MPSSKIFYSLIGLVVAVFAMCNIKPENIENFIGISRAVKVERVVARPNGSLKGAYSLHDSRQRVLGNNNFVSYPSRQGTLSPRFANIDYGANIRYNPPSRNNTGVPANPLTFGHMAKENYAPSCGKGGVPVSQSAQVSGNYDEVASTVYGGAEPTDFVAVGDMTTIDADGDVVQPIIYDRYIYAVRNSRLRGQGDPIRGDLAICPQNNGWFNVSATPNVDLQTGALNVMGGLDNNSSRQMADLIFASSGNSNRLTGGIDLAADSMVNQFTTSASAGLTDINVTSFP
jgi:hypothetical protein